jgi:hypothetical protein
MPSLVIPVDQHQRKEKTALPHIHPSMLHEQAAQQKLLLPVHLFRAIGSQSLTIEITPSK